MFLNHQVHRRRRRVRKEVLQLLCVHGEVSMNGRQSIERGR